MILRSVLLALAIPTLAACAAGPALQAHTASHPQAALFDPSANATEALAGARVESTAQGTRVLVVFGANWCHDSLALAGWLQTPRLAALVSPSFEVVYIDAGVPQTGEGRNLDLAAQYGVSDITGTPTVLVLDTYGTLLNTPEDARSWRNAASRSEDEIHAFLSHWAKPAV